MVNEPCSLKLLRLDDEKLRKHRLGPDDVCYYWREYTAQRVYHHSPTNQLIANLKIEPSEKHRLHHKQAAIGQVADEMISLLRENIFEKYGFVPIPPSKKREDENYDNRLIRILRCIETKLSQKMDIREPFYQKETTEAAHKAIPERRLNKEELLHLYEVEQSALGNFPKNVIIFDDILTRGDHYKAVKEKLETLFGELRIVGLFIARTVYEDTMG